jgi:hypothetical protein
MAAMRVLVCVMVLSGCVTVTAESHFRRHGLSRAVFDLRCPAEELEAHVLSRGSDFDIGGAQVGVRGCGRQVVYVLSRDATWRAETPPQNIN